MSINPWGDRLPEVADLDGKAPAAVRRVLAVDDDDFARLTVTRHLEKRGFEVVAVESVAQAKRVLNERHSNSFECVITDYLMPEQTGVDLIAWMRQHHPTLAAIMVTAIGEKEIVAETLRSGASNFLDKPVKAAELIAAVESAMQLTARRRALQQAEQDAAEVARIQRRMLQRQSASHSLELRLAHFPMQGAGGDFSAVFPIDENRSLVVMADVSGHDLRAAFISAYFQGIVRGLIEAKTPVRDVLQYFNRVLVREWGAGESMSEASTSLAVCAAEIHAKEGLVTVYNHGFPPAYLLDHERGSVCACPGGGPPLGWFEDAVPEEASFRVSGLTELVMWTDGLDDQASRIGVNSWALASMIFARGEGGERPDYLQDAPDDILALRVGLTSAGLKEYDNLLLIAEDYRGSEYREIDDLQARWVRTFRLAVSHWPSDRRDEMVICLRESVLNGMIHGAQKSDDKKVHVEVTYDPVNDTVRAKVDDPGEGHDFDWRGFHQAGGDMEVEHRGLVFLHNLANRVTATRRGASLAMEFLSSCPQPSDLH